MLRSARRFGQVAGRKARSAHSKQAKVLDHKRLIRTDLTRGAATQALDQTRPRASSVKSFAFPPARASLGPARPGVDCALPGPERHST